VRRHLLDVERMGFCSLGTSGRLVGGFPLPSWPLLDGFLLGCDFGRHRRGVGDWRCRTNSARAPFYRSDPGSRARPSGLDKALRRRSLLSAARRQLAQQGSRWVGAVDVGFAFDKVTQAVVSTRTIEIPDARLPEMLEQGMTAEQSLPWPEKAVELHIVVEDQATGVAGSLRIVRSKN